MKYTFISSEKVAFPIAVLCRVMGVSPSGYYASLGREPSAHARGDSVLGAKTTAFFKASKQRYGSPRIHADLKASGVRVSRKRVARLMRENGQKARNRRRFRTTTDSKHEFPIAPNILERDFTAVEPNQKWVTDITFIFTMQGWLYLAVILDLFSRRVVGWAVSRNVDRHLALAALKMATVGRRPPLGIIHHSDRGSTYASADYRKALEDGTIECSMSGKGDCWDNAVAESFFASLKREVENIENMESRAAATLAIRDYIEDFYNPRRRHSSIDYKSPIEFELIHSSSKKAA